MDIPTEDDIQEVEELLRLNLTTGRASQVLIEQMSHGLINRSLHVHVICDEIGALEGAPHCRPSNAKQPAEFTGVNLRGLWHKHYSDPSHILKNIILHWERNFERFGKLLEQEILAGRESVDLTPGVFRRMSHTLVMQAFRDRNLAKKMTGQWIVYAIHNEKNYYLTVGTHNEGDENIAARVRQCADEFPELELRV